LVELRVRAPLQVRDSVELVELAVIPLSPLPPALQPPVVVLEDLVEALPLLDMVAWVALRVLGL
jgi:hypothetical protein